MILCLRFLMPNVLLTLVGSTITLSTVILCALTNFVYPILLFFCYFCKRLTTEDVWDISDTTRPLPHSPSSTFGQRCFAKLHASPIGALHAAKLSHKLNLMVYICPFLFRINYGKISAWILCLDYLRLKRQRFGICCCGPILENGTFHPIK